ncbi:MAG: ABC transporter substrate-binding protein, partial [Betaproteobacteria bacterium]
ILHRAVRIFRAGAFASAVALLLCCGAATAAERLRVCLNWAPGADHAPLYHARQEGWFAAADVAVDILPGGQSADTLRRLAEGECEAAVADFGAVLSARAQDRDVVAVMAIGAHAPYAFYATDGSALRSPADLAGKRIAAYGTDPPRRLWGAFAARHGLALEAVHWIDLPNNAKVEALATGQVDVAANGFYHHHLEYAAAFGDGLGVLWWREWGPDLLGNVLVLPTGAVAAPASARFVALARRAWLACLSAPQPCLEALLAANTHLDPVREARKWPLAARSVAGTDEATEHLGCLDSARVRGTAVAWSLAKNVEAAATNHLLKQAGARCD